jgi:hypothetical protein
MQPVKAHVHKGRLVLDEPTDLPDGDVVYLQFVEGIVRIGNACCTATPRWASSMRFTGPDSFGDCCSRGRNTMSITDFVLTGRSG